jgi:hypothetical protein
MHPFSKNNLNLVFIYGILLLFSPVAQWVAPGLPGILYPRLYLMVLWVIPILILSRLKNVFNRMVCYVWLVWFLIGSINVIASFLFYGRFYLLDVEKANLIYISFTSVLFAIIYLSERYFSYFLSNKKEKIKSTTDLQGDISPFFKIFLMAFPFLWFFSLYAFAGYVPILRGANIEEEMYEVDFGPLYGFAAINILSLTYVFQKFRRSNEFWSSSIYGFLTILFSFFSIASGKRMVLMVFFATAICYLVKTRSNRNYNQYIVIGGIAFMVFMYVGILILRQGFNFGTYQAIDAQLAIVGVEFRDFVYAVNHFNQKMLKHYNWGISTFAAGMNSRLLELVGISKQQSLQMSLGYVAKPLFSGGVFGVRTGLVSELYFAYQFWGLGVISCFGFLTAWVSSRIEQAKTVTSFIFSSIVFALLLLVIVEQSTDVMGTMTVLFYAWVIHLGIKVLFPADEKAHGQDRAPDMVKG